MKAIDTYTLTADQKYCADMLAEWVDGYHHLPTVHECGQGIEINFHGDLSTFDYDRLTRLVLLAHRDFIRIELTNSGPGMVKIMAHRRKPKQEGDSMWAYHPSLDDLIAKAEKMKLQTTPTL